jgi:hypothetical protein
MLAVALACYFVAAVGLSLAQADYINADFVAYAGVAHRLLLDPELSVTGYWSPLFSWLMAPLMALSVDDLVAGRVVLVASGFGYVLAVHWLGLRLTPSSGGHFFRGGLLVCAVLQATLWSGSMLDPDLLANVFMFACLSQLFDPKSAERPLVCLAAGLLGGVGYLAKSYMLPFLVLVLPVWIWFALRARDPASSSHRASHLVRDWLRSCFWCALGLAIVAGPWIFVLSGHYGAVLFSTAGSANHANVGTQTFGSDFLWHPPLELHYIHNPHFGPDWSPLSSWGNCLHQLVLTGKNLLRMAGHLAGWIALVVFGAWHRARLVNKGKFSPLTARDRRIVQLLLSSVVLYPIGYLLIDTERRYVMPSMIPFLGIAGLLLLATGNTNLTSRSVRLQVRMGVLFAICFGIQEVRLCIVAATRHGQMGPLTPFACIADAMKEAGVSELPFAASQWHAGMMIAYAASREDYYYGTPIAKTLPARDAELRAAGVRCCILFPEEFAKPWLPDTWREIVVVPLSLPKPALPMMRIFVLTP